MTARNRAFRIGLLSPVLLFLSLLPLTSSFPHPRAPAAGGHTTPTVAIPAHPAERHSRVGVAALVLPNIRGNKAQALARIEPYVRRAASLGAKIVVTPETCIDGYICHQPGLTRERMCALAEHENGRESAVFENLPSSLICTSASVFRSWQTTNSTTQHS